MISFFHNVRDPVFGIPDRSDTVDIFDCISDLFIEIFNNSAPQYIHSLFLSNCNVMKQLYQYFIRLEHLDFYI